MIKDSGNRREFETGAIRDFEIGKGRCDLMPLDIIGDFLKDGGILFNIDEFIQTGDNEYLFDVLDAVIAPEEKTIKVLELSKHFEAGAVKYGERNWEKGIPLSSYIDSAVRHYLKHLDGQKDENHFIAFIWNIICCIWTNEHLPHMRDLPIH